MANLTKMTEQGLILTEDDFNALTSLMVYALLTDHWLAPDEPTEAMLDIVDASLYHGLRTIYLRETGDG